MRRIVFNISECLLYEGARYVGVEYVPLCGVEFSEAADAEWAVEVESALNELLSENAGSVVDALRLCFNAVLGVGTERLGGCCEVVVRYGDRAFVHDNAVGATDNVD